MKHLALAAVLLPSMLFAQSPQPAVPLPVPQPLPQSVPVQRVHSRQSNAPGDVLPDNYQVNLSIRDKDGEPVEIGVVVGSSHFTASLGDQGINFSGSVTVEESGGIVIAYTLGWETLRKVDNNTSYTNSSTTGSVRLKIGEEVQIFRAGTRTARLSIAKLEAAKQK